MDSDTSITMITVARLRATLASAVGPASATVSSTSAVRSSATGTCRVQPGRFGATFSSSARLVNRMVSRRRRRSSSR